MVAVNVARSLVILCALLALPALSCTLFSVGNDNSSLPYCVRKSGILVCFETAKETAVLQRKVLLCGSTFAVGEQRHRACVKSALAKGAQSRLTKCQNRLARTLTLTAKVPRSLLRTTIAKRLLQIQFNYPFIEYITDSQYHPEIAFYGFPVQPKLPDAAVSLTNWTSALNTTVYNRSFSLGSNNNYGYNYGKFDIPVNASEVQLQFDDTCQFPIVVRSTNGSRVNYQLSRYSSNVYNLRVINGDVQGPLGYQNVPNTHLKYYLNSSTADARANGLYSVVAKFFPGYEYAGSALYIYCPLKANDTTVVNFQATYSNLFLTPNNPMPTFNNSNQTNNTNNNNTNNNTIVDKKEEDSNHLGLILGLVLGIGIPLLLLILGLIIYCCCCRNRNKGETVVVQRAVAAGPGDSVKVSRDELIPVDDVRGVYAAPVGNEQVVINQRNYGGKVEKAGALYTPTMNTLETEHRVSALPSSASMTVSNTYETNNIPGARITTTRVNTGLAENNVQVSPAVYQTYSHDQAFTTNTYVTGNPDRVGR